MEGICYGFVLKNSLLHLAMNLKNVFKYVFGPGKNCSMNKNQTISKIRLDKLNYKHNLCG